MQFNAAGDQEESYALLLSALRMLDEIPAARMLRERFGNLAYNIGSQVCIEREYL